MKRRGDLLELNGSNVRLGAVISLVNALHGAFRAGNSCVWLQRSRLLCQPADSSVLIWNCPDEAEPRGGLGMIY